MSHQRRQVMTTMQQCNDERPAACSMIWPILMAHFCSQQYIRQGLAGGGEGGMGLRMSSLSTTKGVDGDTGFFFDDTMHNS